MTTRKLLKHTSEEAGSERPAKIRKSDPDQFNASPTTTSFLGKRGIINREEYLRCVCQALSELGFVDAATRLKDESGVAAVHPVAADLQQSILSGDWQTACQCIDKLLSNPHAAAEAKFLVLEEKFRELLRTGESSAAAIECLRTELSPLDVLKPRLHALAAELLQADPNKPSCSSSLPTIVEQRQRLLDNLRTTLPGGILLPKHRLETLVETALSAQLDACPFLNDPTAKPSLLRDYTCGPHDQLPKVTCQILTSAPQAHRDEVWHCVFSHDGTKLASASKDGTAAIWKINEDQLLTGDKEEQKDNLIVLDRLLVGHTGPVAFLAWSPDDSKIATCSQDTRVRIWDVATGKLISELDHHCEPVTCCVWKPTELGEPEEILTGGHDRRIFLVNIHGDILMLFETSRVQEVLLAKNGRYLLAATSERCVRIYDLHSSSYTQTTIPEPETLLSMTLSPSERYLLVNLSNQQQHVWDLGTDPDKLRTPTIPVAKLIPSHRPLYNRFVVRSCIGGLGERFVATGSEEGVVYLWHRATGELLDTLEGHKGTVNAVAWNSKWPGLLASASDDGTIRIWQPPGKVHSSVVISLEEEENEEEPATAADDVDAT